MAEDERSKHIKFEHVFTQENPGHIEEIYSFKGKLGEGSYGQVKQAVHKDTGAARAIKTIHLQNIKDKTRFEEEVAIQQKLHHPNIVRLYEVFKDAKSVYLVMELCVGGELFDRIVDQAEQSDSDMAFDERQAGTYMVQILGAMHYLHANNFVHRDIKPENFLMQDKSAAAEIKVIDFGLAKYNPEGTPMKTKAGTPYYVSPQVLSGSYTDKCDIWSCGVICYVLLCGYPPFFGDADPDILKRVKQGVFDYPSPDWDATSKEAKDFINKMLTFSEEQRPSAEEMLTHPWLQVCSKSGSSVPMPTTLVDKLRRFQGEKKLKKVVLTLIAEQLEDKELSDLRETFQELDQDSTGFVRAGDLDQILGGVRDLIGDKRHTSIIDVDDKDMLVDYDQFSKMLLGVAI